MAFQSVVFQGDTKGSAKGGDGSAKKDAQPNPNSQVGKIHTPTWIMLDCIAKENTHTHTRKKEKW